LREAEDGRLAALLSLTFKSPMDDAVEFLPKVELLAPIVAVVAISLRYWLIAKGAWGFLFGKLTPKQVTSCASIFVYVSALFEQIKSCGSSSTMTLIKNKRPFSLYWSVPCVSWAPVVVLAFISRPSRTHSRVFELALGPLGVDWPRVCSID
jgi:hypothetical protein